MQQQFAIMPFFHTHRHLCDIWSHQYGCGCEFTGWGQIACILGLVGMLGLEHLTLLSHKTFLKIFVICQKIDKIDKKFSLKLKAYVMLTLHNKGMFSPCHSALLEMYSAKG